MNNLFKINSSKNSECIELIYSINDGMNAKEIGEAILGMQGCLCETAKVANINDFEIIIFPAESGSFKTVFKFAKKNSWKIIISVDLVFNLINGGFKLIENFGATKTYNSDKQVIKQLQQDNINIKALDLCKNKNFIAGSQKVVFPLKESVNKVEIKYGEKITEIKCENRQKFFEDLEQDVIFPELKNGEQVKIAGEIIRINKEYNDLGFKYKDKTLKGVLLEKDTNITQFHEFIKENQVLLIGIVVRENNFDTPQLKIISIENIENSQYKLPFGK